MHEFVEQGLSPGVEKQPSTNELMVTGNVRVGLFSGLDITRVVNVGPDTIRFRIILTL